jgi:hypothetical protein
MSQSETPKCESCALRKKAEERPRSFMAWLWRVHTRICPGWKTYQRWLADSANTGRPPAQQV